MNESLDTHDDHQVIEHEYECDPRDSKRIVRIPSGVKKMQRPEGKTYAKK